MNVKRFLYSFLAALLVVVSFSQMPTLAEKWEYKTTEDVNKVWKVRFNAQLNSKSLTKSNVYVTDGQNVHPTTFLTSSNGYVVEVKPTTPYQVGKEYQLVIKKSVQSSNGKELKTAIEVPFKIEDSKLKIKSVQSDTNSYFTTLTVQSSAEVHRVTVGGVDMVYQGSNKFTSTLLDTPKGTTVTIIAYDENNKQLETKKYTVK
ncbi:Ig-like domain-containing protein [Psychrobacillus sp. FSL H8-0484]|uniref:Ig-like domain-containing protein n=1 Tax=Psychrobacillus sp. FSL H8-0484 TaxID=2921390 RepID=UPI0030F84959